jgi:hypothetical protein
LVIGQTWSTFSDPEAEPDGIDFEGLNAISLFRQPQVRWTKPLSTGTSLALSVENPNPDLTGAAGLNQVPDFIGRFRWEPRAKESGLLGFLRSGAHIQAAVLLRQLRGAPPDRPNDAVATGGAGINVSGRLEVPRSPDRDYITFAANAGQGIGRYITDLGTLGGQDTVYDPATNTLEALPAYSAYLGYQHWWTESVRSTVTWGGVWVEALRRSTSSGGSSASSASRARRRSGLFRPGRPRRIGPFRDRPCTGTGELRLVAITSLSHEELVQARVRVDDRRPVLHQPPGVSGRAVGAVEVALEHAQQRRLLAAVVGGVGEAPGQDPGPGT